MKLALESLPLRRALGLSIGEREAILSRVVFTPIGPLEVGRDAEPIGSEPLSDCLRRLLGPCLGRPGWRGAAIAVGLPPRSVFFSTRPIRKKSDDVSPLMLLHEILQSPNVVIDDMEVDLLRSQPCKQAIASIVACRKRLLAPILDALAACRVRPARVEPGPCGLLRAASLRHRPPRRARTSLRVFLGAEEALAILEASGMPLMWRTFRPNAGKEAESILSIYRSTTTLCKYFGVESSIGALMIHGRPDLTGLRDADPWREVPSRVVHHQGPDYSGASIATGLAVGCQPPIEDGFNLIRAIAPRPPLRSLVPWGSLALQVGLVAGSTLLMIDNLRSLQRADGMVQAELAAFGALADRPAPELRNEKRDLQSRVESVSRYLETRIRWAECLGDLADGLTPDMAATRISGDSRYDPKPSRRRSDDRRAFTADLETPTPADGAIAPEVDHLMNALRTSAGLSRVLPSIEMTGLKRSTAGVSRTPTASFTIVCRPGSRPS